MLRLIEDEAFRGNDAYTIGEMLEDVRLGVWSELASSSSIDVYRRNLQRTYLNSVRSLMESDDEDVDGSDIKPLLREELRTLKTEVDRAVNRTVDRRTVVHLQDVQNRIENILDPK
jgi:hypothetical protein